jgi:hypothetical protein
MTTVKYTDIRYVHKPDAALSAYVGPWWVEYKLDGQQRRQVFQTARQAAHFGSTLESVEIVDDVQAGEVTPEVAVLGRDAADQFKAVRTALLALCDAVQRLEGPMDHTILNSRIETALACSNAALTMLDVMGVTR